MGATHTLSRALLVLSCLVTAGLACTRPPEEAAPVKRPTRDAPSQYDTNSLNVILPTGKIEAGRQAFLDLKCVVCHRVRGETSFPAPLSDTPGPQLDRTLGLRPASEVANAIIVPSHSMSVRTSDDVKKRLESMLLSPMGDFTRSMTIRQLADLVAYLTSLETK